MILAIDNSRDYDTQQHLFPQRLIINKHYQYITLRKSVTEMFYKLKGSVSNTIHHLLEYLGSTFEDHHLHCQPITNCYEF